MKSRAPLAALLWLAMCTLISLVSPHTLHAQRRSIEPMLKRAEWLLLNDRRERALAMLKQAMKRAPSDPMPVASFAALVLPSATDPRAISPGVDTKANAQIVIDAIERVFALDDTGVGQRGATLDDDYTWALAIAHSHTAAITRWLQHDVLLDRSHAELGRNLAALAIARGDLQAAEQALTAAVRFNAEDLSLRADLAAVLLARGDLNHALPLFREVAVSQPDNLEAQRDLAGALLAIGDAVTALGVLRTIDACVASCDCALENTRAALAAADARAAIDAAGGALRACESSDAEPALWLATAEQLAGHTTQARAAYRLALKRDPASQRARRGLDDIDATPAARDTNTATRTN